MRLDRDKLNKRRKSSIFLPLRANSRGSHHYYKTHDHFSSHKSNTLNAHIENRNNRTKHVNGGRHKKPSIMFFFPIFLIITTIGSFVLLFILDNEFDLSIKNKLSSLYSFLILHQTSSKTASAKDILLDFGIATRVNKVIDTGDGLVGIGTVMLDENQKYQSLIFKLDYEGNVIWKEIVGAEGDEFIYDILKENDGYITVGISSSKSVGVKGRYDVIVTRFDDSGKILWQRNFGGPGWDRAYGIVKVQDSYIFAGDCELAGEDVSQDMGLEDFWTVRISKDGSILWDKVFGGILSDRAYSIDYLEPRNLILVAGSSNSFTDGNRYEGYVLAYKLNGDVEWQVPLSAPAYSTLWPLDLVTTQDSIYVGGYVYEMPTDSEKSGVEKAFIAKISKVGQVEYIKIFGENSRIHSIEYSNNTDKKREIIYFAGYKEDDNERIPWYGSFEYSEDMNVPDLNELTIQSDYGMLFSITKAGNSIILSGSTMIKGKIKGIIRISADI